MKKIIIAGISSSSGKTSIACGILAALKKRGLRLCAYKTGPDYIDTEYLRRAGNCDAFNLDTWLMSENSARELFIKTSKEKDFAIIEGAMGLYDGGENSTAEIAKLLNAPVILVINAKSLGESAAAAALGFREYDKKINIAGVILNCAGSDNHAKIISDALEKIGIKFLGALKRDKNISIPERHLGLLPILENNFDFEKLAEAVEKNINLDVIFSLTPQSPSYLLPPTSYLLPHKRSIAVAHDAAFSFYYPESLEILKELGAELIFFSPLRDKILPEADGYIFGGGFPEIFARELSQNFSMLESVKKISAEKKILAECGGMMYLCKNIKDLSGKIFSMAGVIPFNSFMTERPVIGYMEARALKKNILCEKNKIIRGHEFHYSRIEPEFFDDTCAFELTRRKTGEAHFGGYADENILASYLHVNFFGNLELAENFLR
ncbi:MAG: cobyrinate a,c-diamide synthase [Synergistales bacterium]|nr:cobyrinate a,c-diamide synthase [Synergistales bacterium]MDY6401301.1 cobyrinate a,c-diamide synthase [Synergistales bacterium]MDY6404359.1 cobyrinate a,c-diamide synthase [Synergistales bacterium]MDY6410636.1 cobyrinate a,c-diamide synthase [Synergistales bacterium]MDY6414350.1 cobyrinate a,c-diamide synthase [Synergistales bacterium]